MGNSSGYKAGRVTNDEIEYIAENCERLSVEAMAKHLRRSLATVRKYADVYRTGNGPGSDVDDPLNAPSLDALQHLNAEMYAVQTQLEDRVITDPIEELEQKAKKKTELEIEEEIISSRPDKPYRKNAKVTGAKVLPSGKHIPAPKHDEIRELRETWMWRHLANEFGREEILYFEERFVALCSQFKNDIMPSEQSQIFNVIKIELLMSRNLRERRRCREEVAEVEIQQEEFVKQFNGDPSMMSELDRDYLMQLEKQAIALRSAEQSRTTEYVKLSERHEKLMVSLKGTRDQRIKEIENSNKNWIGILKKFQERDVQEREGRKLELMKLATERELERLGRPTTYEDGNQDHPILSPETVRMGPDDDDD